MLTEPSVFDRCRFTTTSEETCLTRKVHALLLTLAVTLLVGWLYQLAADGFRPGSIVVALVIVALLAPVATSSAQAVRA